MLKKHSKIKLVIFAIIAMLGVLLSVCSFSVPYSKQDFNGFIGSINKGIDLAGGVEAVYSCQLKAGEDKTLEEGIKDASNKIHSLYNHLKFNELYVNTLGEDKIQVLLSDDARVADEIYGYLTTSKPLYITITESATANPYVSADAVRLATIGYDQENSKYGVNIFFTNEGKKDIESLQEHDTAYLYWGDELFTSVSVDEVKDGMFITNDSITYETEALEACYNIMAGSMAVEITDVAVNAFSPTLGVNVGTYLAIALSLIVVLSFVLMYVRYGHFGLLAGLSMVFYLVIFVFLMQAIPFVVMNLVGVVASVVAYFVVLATNCYIFEKIRAEYKLGKKLHISCKSAFKLVLKPIIDSHVALALAAVCLWVFAPASVKLIGVILFASAIISVFISLVLTRYFVNLYLPINSTKAKKLHLYRDKNVKEIVEEEVEIISPDQVTSQNVEGENE